MKDTSSLTRCRALAAAFLSLLALDPSGRAMAAPVTAKPAFAFVDSVGVVSKFTWGSSPYRTRYPQAKAALAELGIRHYRDSTGNAEAMQVHRDLNNSLSMRLTAIIDTRRGSGASERLDMSGVAGEVQRASTLLGRRIIAGIEGPNEYNILERDYGYTGWPQDLKSYQTELFRRVQADPQLHSVPVLSASLGGPDQPYYYRKLGSSLANVADAGNVHLYANWFSFAGWAPQILPYARTATPGKKFWVTESGWHTAYNSGRMFVPEDVLIRYLPRAMADFATHPEIIRGFIYQLIDPHYNPQRTSTNAHFGLLDYNVNKKRSFYAVRNMMHIMCDNRPTAASRSLDHTLSGNLTDVRAHLFQKRSGSFSLLIWVEKPLYGRSGRLINPPQAVALRFNQPITMARRYVPSDPGSDLAFNNRPQQTYWDPTTINLNVPDHMVVLEIFPRGIPITPVNTSCNFIPS